MVDFTCRVFNYSTFQSLHLPHQPVCARKRMGGTRTAYNRETSSNKFNVPRLVPTLNAPPSSLFSRTLPVSESAVSNTPIVSVLSVFVPTSTTTEIEVRARVAFSRPPQFFFPLFCGLAVAAVQTMLMSVLMSVHAGRMEAAPCPSDSSKILHRNRNHTCTHQHGQYNSLSAHAQYSASDSFCFPPNKTLQVSLLQFWEHVNHG